MFSILLFCTLIKLCVTTKVDTTLIKNSYGDAVVLATVQKIQDSCIFPNDYQFMRRVAWIETYYGRPPMDINGIWHITDNAFVETLQNLSLEKMLAIQSNFGLNITSLERVKGDLETPLYGGLVARSFMYLNGPIPLSVDEQDKFWKQYYYNHDGSENRFNDLESGMQSVNPVFGVDLLFIIDSSENISSEDFQLAINLTTTFVEFGNVVITPSYSQVAVDVGSSGIQFGSYKDKVDFLEQLSRLQKLNESEIALQDAIDCAWQKTFAEARNRKFAFPRIAVLITASLPNNVNDVKSAAGRLKEQGIDFYTVGIGDKVDMDLLRELASEPNCMHAYYVDSGSVHPLATEFINHFSVSIAKAPISANAVTNRVDAKDQIMFIEFTVSQAGVIFKVTYHSGSVMMYLSKSFRHPSSVINDWEMHGQEERHISFKALAGGIKKNGTTNETVIYAAVVGQESNNSFSITYYSYSSDTNSGLPIAWKIAIPFIIACIILIIIAFFCFYHHRKAKARAKRWNVVQGLARMASDRSPARLNDNIDLEKKDPWEQSRDRIVLDFQQKLGSGAFGEVYKGNISGDAPICNVYEQLLIVRKFHDCYVAAKTLPEYADKFQESEFLREMKCMKDIGYCPYLVNLIGCITDCKPYVLLLEYCANGDLKHFLLMKKQQQQKPIEDSLLNAFLSFSWQISTAMDYLHSRGIIHRDLAARNVLLDEELKAKVGDFGLSRTSGSDNCYISLSGRLPIKWMALESLESFQCTTKSDVWSYGVVVWEILTFGQFPYGVIDAADMKQHLAEGHRLEKPELCPIELYKLMLSCWHENPDLRPKFSEIRDQVAVMLDKGTVNYGYLDVQDEENNG